MHFSQKELLLQEKEFLKMFQIPVIEVPTNLPNIRKDLPIQAFAVGHSIFILDFVSGFLYFNLTNDWVVLFLDCSWKMGSCSSRSCIHV